MHVVFLYFAIGVVLAGGTGRRWLIAGWGPAFLAALVFVGCLGYFLTLFYGAYLVARLCWWVKRRLQNHGAVPAT